MSLSIRLAAAPAVPTEAPPKPQQAPARPAQPEPIPKFIPAPNPVPEPGPHTLPDGPPSICPLSPRPRNLHLPA